MPKTPPDESGPRPRPTGAPPSPSGPPDPAPPKDQATPRLRAVDDPVKLAHAARIMQAALARNGRTFADLRAPVVEHARAA